MSRASFGPRRVPWSMTVSRMTVQNVQTRQVVLFSNIFEPRVTAISFRLSEKAHLRRTRAGVSVNSCVEDTSGRKWFYILYCDSNMCDPFCKAFKTVAESQSIVYICLPRAYSVHILGIPNCADDFLQRSPAFGQSFLGWKKRSDLRGRHYRQECLRKNNNDITWHNLT